MAIFTDQFQRRDPLSFNASDVLEFWPRQIAFEARDLLEGHTAHQVEAIAKAVEALIVSHVDHLVIHHNPFLIGFGSHPPKEVRLNNSIGATPELMREQFGDANIFIAATSASHSAAKLPFTSWEGLAVIALWKLVDFYDILLPPIHRSEHGSYERPTPEERASRLRKSAPLLVEAMRASTLGAEGRIRAQQLGAMQGETEREVAEALYRADAERRLAVSEKSRASVNARHEKTRAHINEALGMANKRDFKSFEAAARYIADNLEKSPNAYYTAPTVVRWLRAGGWTPKKGASTP